MLLGLGSLVNQVHELVELGGDDDLGAAVALLADLGVIGGHGIVLSTASGGEALGVYAIVILQGLDDRGGSQAGEVPIVADIGPADGHGIGIALDEDVVGAVVLDDLGDLAEGLPGALIDLVAAGLVEHIVGQGDVDDTLEDLHIDFLLLTGGKGTGEIVGEDHIEAVTLVLGLDELLDEAVGGVNLVDELGDIDIALGVLLKALIKRPLQILVCPLQFCIALLGIGMVAIPTSILSSGFLEYMAKKREASKAAGGNQAPKLCPHCGKPILSQNNNSTV